LKGINSLVAGDSFLYNIASSQLVC